MGIATPSALVIICLISVLPPPVAADPIEDIQELPALAFNNLGHENCLQDPIGCVRQCAPTPDGILFDPEETIDECLPDGA